MVQLRKDLKEIEAAGAQGVGISYDSVTALKKFTDAQQIAFPLLSDEGSKTIDAYGIRNKEAKPGSRQDGIPYPGTYIIDQNGVVRAKLFLDGYMERAETTELIKAAMEVR